MKITPSKSGKVKQAAGLLPFPFERPKVPEIDKMDLITVEIAYEEGGDRKYKKYLRKIEAADGPELLLRDLREFEETRIKMQVNTGPSAFDMCRNHFKGPVKDRFLEISRDFQSETLENYEEAIEKIKKHFLPPRCYLRMRRGLRRDPSVNKPMGSTTRKWAARVQEYNSLLLEIPGSRGKLDDDELIEIIEFGLPRSWRNKFIEHNFDASQKTIIELVEFCERLEALKDVEKTLKSPSGDPSTGKTDSRTGGSKSANKNKNKKNHKRNHSSPGGCDLHGPNCGHDNNSCKVLKAQAKKMKLSWETNKGTHNSDRAREKKYSQHEVNELVTKAKRGRSEEESSLAEEEQNYYDALDHIEHEDQE